MKKFLLLALISTLALSAVACGKTEESEITEAVEETTAEATTEDDSWGDALRALENDLPDFDSHAGINMKAEPLPETAEIPDDWHEVTDGNLSFRVPPDVEMDTVEIGDYKSTTAKSEDRTVTIMFYDGNDWSVDDETEYEDILSDDEMMKQANEMYDSKGYPTDDYYSDAKTYEYMAELGLDYDGTRESEYRALLEFSEDMRTDSNKEAFEYVASLKAITMGMSYPKIYFMEADGKPVYIHEYPGIYYDPSKSADKEYKSMWRGAFTSPDMEYTALVRGHDKEEALKIASTIKVID